MKKLLLALIVFSAVDKINAQEWTVYNTLNSGIPSDVVNGVAISGIGDICVATDGGSGRFDGTNLPTYYPHSLLGAEFYTVRMIATEGSTTVWYDAMGHMGAPHGLIRYEGTSYSLFQYYNSGLPYDYVNSMAFDGNGIKWMGTNNAGLVKFDGDNWTIYNQSNSGMPSDEVTSVKTHGKVVKWVGTNGGGLARFDGENWKVYNPFNSGLPSFYVKAIDIDCYGAVWIGTEYGLAKFNYNGWTVYNTANSDLPGNRINSIDIDRKGIKWIGTTAGLAEFNGMDWTVHNKANSGLPSDCVKSVAIDENDVKWIGTLDAGLASYSGGGEVSYDNIIDDTVIVREKDVLYSVFPNPTRQYTAISFYLPYLTDVSLSVFDMQGKLVATLINREKLEGEFAINFDVRNLSAGIYFYQLQTDMVTETKKMVVTK